MPQNIFLMPPRLTERKTTVKPWWYLLGAFKSHVRLGPDLILQLNIKNSFFRVVHIIRDPWPLTFDTSMLAETTQTDALNRVYFFFNTWIFAIDYWRAKRPVFAKCIPNTHYFTNPPFPGLSCTARVSKATERSLTHFFFPLAVIGRKFDNSPVEKMPDTDSTNCLVPWPTMDDVGRCGIVSTLSFFFF